MIDVKMERGIIEHMVITGSVFDVAADVTALVAAIHAGLKQNNDGSEVVFRKCVEAITRIEGVFDDNPYDDDPLIHCETRMMEPEEDEDK